MLFGAATNAIWGILIFCEKSVGCFFLGAFSFHARTQGAVPRFTGTTQNTITTTKHRNDHSIMKKEIQSGSGDDGGKGKKGFDLSSVFFYKYKSKIKL